MSIKSTIKAMFVAGGVIVATPFAIAGDDNDDDDYKKKDRDVSLEQVPTQARAAIEKQVGAGRLHDIEREMRGNQTVFEVEFYDQNGAKFEMIVAEDGKVLNKRPD